MLFQLSLALWCIINENRIFNICRKWEMIATATDSHWKAGSQNDVAWWLVGHYGDGVYICVRCLTVWKTIALIFYSLWCVGCCGCRLTFNLVLGEIIEKSMGTHKLCVSIAKQITVYVAFCVITLCVCPAQNFDPMDSVVSSVHLCRLCCILQQLQLQYVYVLHKSIFCPIKSYVLLAILVYFMILFSPWNR